MHQTETTQGFAVFFTGLPASGKSTLAEALTDKLTEAGRPVTLLDGDIVRQRLSPDLGFSSADRDLNIHRIGFIASEVVRHRGAAVCAAIAPYAAPRQAAREAVSQFGAFLEVYVSTPIGVCEERDPKGLYARARKGLIAGFTGIDDPYEEPKTPELRLDTSKLSVDQAVDQIWDALLARRLIDPSVNLNAPD